MAEIVISLVAKLGQVLTSQTINITREMRKCLKKIKKMIDIFRIRLVDAESKWDELPNQQRELLRKLKDVMYDADDLFDGFLTSGATTFSRKMSREVKDIRKRLLAAFYADKGIFTDILDGHGSIIERTKEASSDVHVDEIIIGRDNDKDSVINVLLHHPNYAASDVQSLIILGVEGLGKTTLAELVFDDVLIKQEFPDPSCRIWVSASDSDREQFDFEMITHVLDKIEGRTCFLVLDDFWNKSNTEWFHLKEILKSCQRGSKILVTTRSMRMADIIADHSDGIYLLQRLSKEDSWRLFEMLACTLGSEEKNHHEFVVTGKNIVEKCYGIPLAIQMVAKHLFGQPISKWQSFERSGPSIIGKGDSWILPMIKPSYLTLQPLEKSCFRYCAIFPKDVRIQREKIIGLWMAQGYVRPMYKDQNIEYAAEELFLRFLDMSFFEHVVRDEYGDVESFKLHNWVHDVAQAIGQEEICITTSHVNCLGHNIRHVHHVGDDYLDTCMYSNKIRSYVSGGGYFIHTQIENWMRLRVLNLSNCDVKNLPDSIGKMRHLRYLDLSYNKNLQLLCASITQLYNLQTLDLEKCDMLTCMPSGMDKLTNLRVLPSFVVGSRISNKKQSREGMLNDLEALCKIRGKICIKIGTNYRTLREDARNDGAYLKSMKYLREIRVEFADGATCAYNPEVVLDTLEPPLNIKGIFLRNYKGTRIGRWGRAYHSWTMSFPHLVHIVISKCENLQQMPLLSKLSFLKTLSLSCLDSLEYMEIVMSRSRNDEAVVFFPSLETLKIMWMERLKGWCKKEDEVGDWGLRLRFPRLKYLKFFKCPNLMSFAPCQSLDNMPDHEVPNLCSLKIANCPNLAFNLICPTVETLDLRDTGERFQITCGYLMDDKRWRHVEVDRVRYLKQVSSRSLTRLCLHGDSEVESLSEVEDAFQSCACSLRELEIRYCANLRQLSGLQVLTALQKLKLLSNNNLSISDDDEEPWKFFHQTLLHLKFDALPEMKSLPKGMQCFISLQILELQWCESLEELPQWMSCLSSLKSLSIIHCPRIRFLPESMKDLTSLKNLSIQHGCPVLFTRCKNPDGEDFPKIQHISNISIG